MRRRVLNVSDPDVFSGEDQIDERDQGSPDTGRNEKIVGVDIVHGIERDGFSQRSVLFTADGTETL
jgi:hypothetical protein